MRRVAGLDWRIALLIAVTLVMAGMAVSHSRALACKDQGPRVQAEQKAEGGLEQEQPSQGATGVTADKPTFSDHVIASPPSGESKDQTEECNQEGAEFWPSFFGLRVKITDSLLILLTAALAIYTRELNRSTLKLWEAGERQINIAKDSSIIARDALIASNRPWLKLNASMGDQPLIVNETGAQFSVCVEVINVGSTPAIDLNIETWMLIFTMDPDLDPFREHERRLGQPILPGIGQILFPGESFPKIANIDRISHAMKIEPDIVRAGVEAGRGQSIMLYVGGRVSYSSSVGHGSKHYTAFLRHLTTIDRMPIDPRIALTSPSNLLLRVMPFGEGNTAT